MYQFFIDEHGVASVEYALLMSLVGMAIAGCLQILGGSLFNIFSALDGVLSSVQFSDDSLRSKK